MKVLLVCLAIFVTGASHLIAQGSNKTNDNDPDDPYNTKSYFMFGVNYLSDNVYLGRRDTAKIPYVSSYIGYHDKSGLYTKLIASYAPTKRQIDLLTIEAGYDHDFGDHLNVGVDADKFFYNKNSNNIRSSTKGSAGVNGQYTNDIIEPQVSFNLDLNKKTDYVLELQLDHDFDFLKKKLHIIPAVSMNSGTQHYYDEYFINRLKKNDKSLKLKNSINEAGKFKPLDYEISTKVTYRTGKWMFILLPTYFIPVSPATITFPKQSFTEKLSNSFVLELDICHR